MTAQDKNDILHPSIKNKIRGHSIDAGFDEVCGVIIRLPSNKIVVRRLVNRAKKPKNNFAVAFSDFKKAKKDGRVIGVYHSHPIGVQSFSELDKVYAEKTKLDYVLYNVKTDSLDIYEPHGYAPPLLERPFSQGIFDCYTLVQDYYRRKLNITLSDADPVWIERLETAQSAWEEVEVFNVPSNTALRDLFLENNFIEIRPEEIKRYDVLLVAPRRFFCAVHCIIFLGKERILHHPFGEKSYEQSFSNYWKKRVKYRMRHQLLR